MSDIVKRIRFDERKEILVKSQKSAPVFFQRMTEASTPPAASAGTNIPDPPSAGTYVLGVVGGTLQWIATEEC